MWIESGMLSVVGSGDADALVVGRGIVADVPRSVCCWTRPRVVPTRMNRSRCHSGRGLEWAQGTMYWGADPRGRCNFGGCPGTRPFVKICWQLRSRRAEYCDELVCLSVCLSVCASVSSSPVLRVRRSSNVCECHVCPSAARSSSVSVAICYVLPVCGVSVDRASDEHRAMAIGSTSAYAARPVFVLGFLSCGSCTDCDCRLQTQWPDSYLRMCDVVSARCCRFASKLQEDCYLSASMGLTTAWSRPSDLMLTCCLSAANGWLVSRQTNSLDPHCCCCCCIA